MKRHLYHPQFFTVAILEWKHLLKPDKYKELIIESLRFLTDKKRVEVFAFVIMTSLLGCWWPSHKAFTQNQERRNAHAAYLR